MIEVMAAPKATPLEERLARGAELLFDMERRGEIGHDYQRWLGHWMQLLEEYEAAQAA